MRSKTCWVQLPNWGTKETQGFSRPSLIPLALAQSYANCTDVRVVQGMKTSTRLIFRVFFRRSNVKRQMCTKHEYRFCRLINSVK